jgi:outer membrane protein assembly factor BamB
MTIEDLRRIDAVTTYYLYAVDIKTKRILWLFETDHSPMFARPLVTDMMVYLGAGYRDPHLYALDTATGKEQWRFDVGGMDTSPVLVGDTIYAAAESKMLYAIDAVTGRFRWRIRLSGQGDGLSVSPDRRTLLVNIVPLSLSAFDISGNFHSHGAQ